MARTGRSTRRAAHARKAWSAPAAEAARGHRETSSALHEERLDAVMEVLRGEDVRSVADLGCGSGALLTRLAGEPRFTRVVGVDASAGALATAERALAGVAGTGAARVALEHGSLLAPGPAIAGVDAAVLVETIEHLPPASLSRLERGVFATLRPRVVVLTTPNRDYNPRLGLAADELRHADHRFEWSRSRFRAWAEGVARRAGYSVRTGDVGRADPLLGSATQLAVFRRAAA